MRESTVEKYLKEQVELAGGEIRKLAWIGHRSAPDRAVFLNGVYFVETKRPGLDATQAQAREHNKLRKHGADVRVINTKEKVDEFIREITRKKPSAA